MADLEEDEYGLLKGRFPNPPEGRCQKCNERPATEWFTPGPFDIFHGGGQGWCEICRLTAQIEHAEERAKALPGLRARLAAIHAESKTSE